MKQLKTLLTLLLILNLMNYTFSQNCYKVIADVSGFDTSPHLVELENRACELKQAFPAEFQNQFNVYDFGFYSQNEFMEGGFQSVWDEVVNEITSQYYLVFGKQSDENGIFTKFWIQLKLPESGPFSCYNQNYHQFVKTNIEGQVNDWYSQNNSIPFLYSEAEKLGMTILKEIVLGVVDCCDNNLKSICSLCPPVEDIRSYMENEGFLSFETNITNISDQIENTTSYSNKSLDDELLALSSIEISDPNIINLNIKVQTLLNSFSERGFSYSGFITSDNNTCFIDNNTAFKKSNTFQFSDILELYDESQSDFNIWVHASKDDLSGDRIFIKYKSNIDSYESTVLHNDLNEYNGTSSDDDYPEGILIRNGFKFDQPYGSYSFNLPATTLLSLVSNVPSTIIDNTLIMKRAPGQYLPWFINDCGGGITLGFRERNWYRIYYTENYFSNSGPCHRGDDIIKWLEISSHEVRHLLQILENHDLIGYVSRFIWEYVKYGSHDVPLEEFADIGQTNFKDFHVWIMINKGSTALEDLFNNNTGWVRQSEEIQNWWDEYKN